MKIRKNCEKRQKTAFFRRKWVTLENFRTIYQIFITDSDSTLKSGPIKKISAQSERTHFCYMLLSEPHSHTPVYLPILIWTNLKH